MACPIGGAFVRVYEKLAAAGYKDEQIVEMMSKASTYKEELKKAIDTGVSPRYVSGALASGNTEIKNTAAAALLQQSKEKILDWGYPDPKLGEGLTSAAKKTLYEKTNSAAWTNLSEAYDQDKAWKDPSYAIPYILADEANSVKFIEDVKKYANESGDSSTVVALVNLMGNFGEKNVKETKAILAKDEGLDKIYTDYYKDYRNVKKDEIVIDAIYGSMTWKNGLGEVNDNTKFNTVDGAGRVWTPLEDGTWGYNPEFVAEFKDSKDYKSATWTLNRENYAKLLISGELDGKTPDEQSKIMEKLGIGDINNKAWWTCVGTMCGAELAEESMDGGGGGGGGSGNSGYTPKAEEPIKETEILYIECNIANAGVWNKETGSQIGSVNTSITLKKGAYTIQVKAEGYITRELPVTIGAFPTSKTINLVKQGPSISTFIRGIGGIQNLTKTKYLYLFCMWKMRMTSIYTWKQFADSIDSVESSAFPSLITKEDVLYVYYLVNGDISSAQALVDAGQVTLLDAEGGGINKIQSGDIESSGGI